LPS
ncbi:M6 family metalloprotease domain protein, partial [Vibrio parahaemolyticus V-223/04]|jgi:HEAT repeat protein